MKLNAEQKTVVALPPTSRVKILAGAGTGKTRALTERYLKFVFEDAIPPERLLALTFTKKAAAEMHARVFDGVTERGDRRILRQLYGAWIMNFHQFAYRVIHENAPAFAIDPSVDIASEVDLERVRRVLLRRFEAGRIDGVPDDFADDLPAPGEIQQYFLRCYKVVDKARGGLWTPQSLSETVRADDVPEYRRFMSTVVAVWRAFEAELRARGLLDFNDLIRIVVRAFAGDTELRDGYRRRFSHILVDEFQDTSEAQNELLRLLAGDDFSSVTVVGDEKQSIYRWRDARVENLRAFPGETFYLKSNYRSTRTILDTAFHFIIEDPYFAGNAEAIRLEAAGDQNDRGDAPLWLFHPPDGTEPSAAAEARALGAWIQYLAGMSPKDCQLFSGRGGMAAPLGFDQIAILLRSLKPSSGLPDYEAELQRIGIPYAILGGVSAIESQVLERFKSLLRLLIDPADVRAFLSLVEARPFRAPDAALYELFAQERNRFCAGEVLDDRRLGRLSDTGSAARLGALQGLLVDLDARRSQLDLATFVTEAMERAPFYYDLFAEGADLRIVDSVTKRLLEIIEQLERRGEANLGAFVEAIDTLLSRRQFNEQDAPYVPPGRVVIMTMHQAKGLEFDAVAVPGIKAPPKRSDGFLLIPGHGLYLSGRKEWNRDSKSRPEYEVLKAERDQEERCLLYVAMTRARRYLFLSSPHAMGIEPRGGENYFASIMRAVGISGVPFEELREIGEAESVAVQRRGVPPGARHDLEDRLLAQWQAGRSRLEEGRMLGRIGRAQLHFATWRGLLAFCRCPRQYHYRFVAKLADDVIAPFDMPVRELVGPDARVPRGMRPEQFGTFMHRFLWHWARDHDTRGPAVEIARELANAWDGDVGSAVDMAVDLAAAYEDAMRDDEGKVYALEWAARRRVGDVVFHGVVDRVDRVGETCRVVDYKIGRRSDDYNFQVMYYAWLLSPVLDLAITKARIFYLQEQSEIVDVSLAPASFDRLSAEADAFASARMTGEYPAAPGSECRVCDYRDICPHSA